MRSADGLDLRAIQSGLDGLARPAWLDGLAALLDRTSLQIVAEGIESPLQAEVLRNAGVQWGQGHLFSPPLSVDEFKDYSERASAGGRSRASASPHKTQARPIADSD